MAETEAILNSPVIAAATSGIVWSSEVGFDTAPLPQDGVADHSGHADHRQRVETLAALAGRLEQVAKGQTNQLRPDVAEDFRTYRLRLKDEPLNPRLIAVVIDAIRAELLDAIEDKRLTPGTLSHAQNFLAEHDGFIRAFYPAILEIPATIDALPDDEAEPEDLAPVLQRLGGVLREPEMPVTDALRDAFTLLERATEGAVRRKMLGQIEDATAEAHVLSLLRKRIAGSFQLLFATVQEVVLLKGVSDEQKVSFWGNVLTFSAALQAIWPLLGRLMPRLFG